MDNIQGACVHAQPCSGVRHSVIPRMVALQDPVSVKFSRHKYWSGLPFPPPEYLFDPGIEPVSPASPAFAGGFFTTESPGKPLLRESTL